MHQSTKNMVSRLLRGKKFGACVDLGCGDGGAGEVLKPHCNVLVGVDRNIGRLSVAKNFGGYDTVVWMDVREYEIPDDVQAAFVFDLIEHLPKKDGFDLLLKLRKVPYVLLTTPSKYFPLAADGHVTLWSRRELEENGFKVTECPLAFPTGLLYGKHLLALRS